MTKRFVCIHGHFYQPPRENPWLESVERQESALPYHDWNQRVTAECYAPNAASRVLDERARIVEIVNNYSSISFNFGATLLSWMEVNTRFTYDAILQADRTSRENFGGHGSALAQVHGHLILPLAHTRDKETQVEWGIRDFEHRFGRSPEGMWLAETAVDLESLDIMAAGGILFTILAPHQAAAVRSLEGDGEWRDVSDGGVDPTVPYRVELPSGRSIVVFFYDGPASRAVAFEDLLRDGRRFADRILSGLPREPDRPRLAHIATDGETYGHHHMHGEMALSYGLERIRRMEDVRLTNYAEFLELHPPRDEARIVEDSSWSCVHGVERWRSDCGCSTGGRPGWNQAWRAPLRRALDHLRDRVAPLFEEEAAELLVDPWKARNAYVRVLLDRSPESVSAFLDDHTDRELTAREEIRARKLMELQRHAMLMFTSCGWFFAELTGIETVQVLHYAGRVIQLAEQLFATSFEEPFLDILEVAKSNLPEGGDGREVYTRNVLRARVDLEGVAAHYALGSLFGSPAHDVTPKGGPPDPVYGQTPENTEGVRVYCYQVHIADRERTEVGRSKLEVGWGHFSSEVTGESERLSYAALHAGDHNLVAGVRNFRGVENFRSVAVVLGEAFTRGELPEVVRVLDREFGTPSYSLRSLFRDEQQDIVNQLFESSVREAENVLSQLYRERASLMRFGAELGVPQPRVFQVAAEFVLDHGLREALGARVPDIARTAELLERAREGRIHLDPDEIGYSARKALEQLSDQAADHPDDPDRLRVLEEAVDLLLNLEFRVNTWGSQNSFHRLLRDRWAEMEERAADGDEAAGLWIERIRRVGEKLSVAVPGNGWDGEEG